MIKTLELENFKCFSRLKLNLGALTLLTGYNAGGKSSAIQPLLLLSQAARVRTSSNRLALNGPIVKLGTVGDVLPANSSVSRLVFKIANEKVEQTWCASARASERQLDVQSSILPLSEINNELIEKIAIEFQRSIANLTYLSAVRVGPEDTYPTPGSYPDSAADVGTDGRFAAYWHEKFVDEEIPEERRCPGENSSSFRKQFDAWFSTLFPNAQVSTQQYSQLSLQSLQFRISEFGAWRRPANVGYGFSYAFPVLVALLAAEPGQVVVIDSPEAHLHPLAQSRMGRLIAHLAASGVQVVVETHSDHLLNGVRLAVKDQILKPDELRMHFFSGTTGSEHGVISLSIDNDGRIENWPEGFFDQSEKDLARLSGWE